MNSQIKTILIAVLLVTLLGSAYFAYSVLSKNYKPKTEGINEIGNSSITSSSLQSADTSPQSVDVSLQSETEKLYPAPDFTVTDLQGNSVKLSDFLGKPVVVNFWTSWCPSCKSEMPHFNEVYSEYKDSTVFLMIDLVDGQRETQVKGQSYVEGQGFTFPIYFDTKQSASDAYNIMYIPTTIFIDAEGNIANAYQGAIDKDTLIAGIKSIQD